MFGITHNCQFALRAVGARKGLSLSPKISLADFAEKGPDKQK